MIKKILFIGMVLFFSQLSCMDTLNDAYNAHSGLDMVYVPAGTFQRDATAANTSYVSAFYMAKYEVTRAQFNNVTGYDPSNTNTSPTSDCPVQQANWYDAIAFCNRLSIREGLTPVYTINGNTNPDDWGEIPTSANNAVWDAATCNMNADGYRLPTEMEWRWAAMGATSGAGDHSGGVYTNGYERDFAGDTGSNSVSDYAWYNANSYSRTYTAGTKMPNELGLYDMSGNVYERCWDGQTAFNASPRVPNGSLTNYTGDNSTAYRVMLGGTWSEGTNVLLLASVPPADYPASARYVAAGFRVVRSAGKGHVPRSGLVGEWLFDNNNGTTTYDTSGSGNDGVLASGGTTSPSEVSGYPGQAYSFNSNTDGIKITGGVTNPLNVSYITVSFFIYPTANGKVIMKDNENATDPGTYQVEINGSNRFSFACFTGSGRVIIDVVSDVIAMNRWYHVACTFNGAMMRIYIDGALNSEMSSGSTISLTNNLVSNYSTHIGNVPTGNDNSFNGTIDSVRIYNRALSTTEIKLLADE